MSLIYIYILNNTSTYESTDWQTVLYQSTVCSIKPVKQSFDINNFCGYKEILGCTKSFNSNIWYSAHHVLRTRKSLTHHEGTALMWLSNPFIVDNLLKIVWFQLTISDKSEELTSP